MRPACVVSAGAAAAVFLHALSVHPPHLPPHPHAAANALTPLTSAAELVLSALEAAEVFVNATIGAHTHQPRLCRHTIAQLYRHGTTVSPAMICR